MQFPAFFSSHRVSRPLGPPSTCRSPEISIYNQGDTFWSKPGARKARSIQHISRKSIGIIVRIPTTGRALQSGRAAKRRSSSMPSINPTTLKANTLIYEWAHMELRYKPSRTDRSTGRSLPLSDSHPKLEEEANWLVGCMFAPRDGLLFHCGRSLESAERLT